MSTPELLNHKFNTTLPQKWMSVHHLSPGSAYRYWLHGAPRRPEVHFYAERLNCLACVLASRQHKYNINTELKMSPLKRKPLAFTTSIDIDAITLFN